jgi:hypothetical protein
MSTTTPYVEAFPTQNGQAYVTDVEQDRRVHLMIVGACSLRFSYEDAERVGQALLRAAATPEDRESGGELLVSLAEPEDAAR